MLYVTRNVSSLLKMACVHTPAWKRCGLRVGHRVVLVSVVSVENAGKCASRISLPTVLSAGTEKLILKLMCT